jgi:hypothetical protein
MPRTQVDDGFGCTGANVSPALGRIAPPVGATAVLAGDLVNPNSLGTATVTGTYGRSC